MKFYLLFFLAISANCFAIHKILPLKYSDQQEIFMNGETVLVSKKQNSIVLSAKEGIVKKGRSYLVFSLQNQTSAPVNLRFNNVRLTDQYGRVVYVIPKDVLLNEERTKSNWKKFGSVLLTTCEAINAQDAGTISYSETTHSHYHGSSGSISGTTTTYGTLHNEALRQHAMDRVNANAFHRNMIIDQNYYYSEAFLKNFYFDSNTIMPNIIYESSFQFEIPTKVEKDIDHLFVTFDLEQESHTFCLRCL